MVGSKPREGCTDHFGCDDLHRRACENVIDAQDRHAAWESREAAVERRRRFAAPELGREELAGAPQGERVEVAREQSGIAEVGMSQPFGADERVDLGDALARGHAEMGVDDLELFPLDLYLRP